jgi:hypothetical protein
MDVKTAQKINAGIMSADDKAMSERVISSSYFTCGKLSIAL